MSDSNSSGVRVPVAERSRGEASRIPPTPSVPLPVPDQKLSRVRSIPSVPSSVLSTPSRENDTFVHYGLLPSRDSELQRRERRMFLAIFIGMLILFAALLTVILVSQI